MIWSTPRNLASEKGTTPMQASLDAGYSQRSAEHAGELLDTIAMRDALQRFLPTLEKIGQRISEGLDAMETKFFQHGGRVTESCDVVAWSERRQYAEQAIRLLGLDPGQGLNWQELCGMSTSTSPASQTPTTRC